MWIGDILQDILVELLNGNWLSIITFTNYNCFSLFMAVLRDCYFSSLAAGELPARRSLSSLPADAARGPAERREHLPWGLELPQNPKGNPLEMFPHCPSPLATCPIPPSTSPPLPGIPRAGDRSPACVVGEGWHSPANAGARSELEWLCNSEFCDVTGGNDWYFMFRLLIWSQGQGGAFSSLPLWGLWKTLFSSVRTASNTKPSNIWCSCLCVILG